MAFFKSAEDKLASEIASKLAKQVKDRTDNAGRLAVAEGKLAACRTAADQAALGDDDAALDARLAAKRAAEDKVTALKDASTKIARAIGDLETQATAVADRKQRLATAAEIEKIATDLERAGEAFEQAAKELAAAARRANLAAPDALPLISYAEGAAGEVPPAVAMVAEVLRHRAVLTISGSAPATLPKPEAPAPVLTLVQPKTRTVFALKHLVFTDADGRQHRFPKMNDATLPESIAAEAIRRGVACEGNDPRRKQYKGAFGLMTPALAHCVALDGTVIEPAPKATTTPITPPIKHTAFEVVDRGPPIVGTMRTTPVVEPMASTRSAAPDEG
jgi:hypothetical protein